LPDKAVTDVSVRDAILDDAMVAHVGIVVDGQPYVLPVAYARDHDRLLMHGSTGSRLFRALAAGAPACVTVTILDGLIVARSAFESSMRYRSVTVLGVGEAVAGDDALAALRTITEHLLPGRWDQLRAPLPRELEATQVVAMTMDEWSVKVGQGWPEDIPADRQTQTWAGVIPLALRSDPPLPDPGLASGIEAPTSIASWAWPRGGGS
jgi:nitroimidazol reductase NimA-like FMN-containing flavoprotein (pyridoxamine 5'-phosphate oxidase superfamily)